MEHGIRQVEAFIRGPGAGREAAVRALTAAGILRHQHSRRYAHPSQRLQAPQAQARIGDGPDHRPSNKETQGETDRHTWHETPKPYAASADALGEKLFLKGDRCYSPKCGVERRRRPPGDQGTRRPRRPTDWALQLREKQKARFTYGVLERQFKKYFADARESQGVTGDVLLQLLERRLDNVVYRLSFVDSRPQARQIVNHGHFNVNGRKVSIPSFRVRPGDVITWRRVTDDSTPGFVEALTDGIPKRPVPSWLKLEPGALTGEVLSLPERSEIDTGIDVRLIVEFYSR